MPALPSAVLFPLGRVLLASLFVLGGLNKLATYEATLADMAAAGLPAPGLLLPLVILGELGAGLVVAAGRGPFRLAALGLAAYTVLVNLVFHDFWTLTGEMRTVELSLFFKNVAVAGGLVMLAGARRA